MLDKSADMMSAFIICKGALDFTRAARVVQALHPSFLAPVHLVPLAQETPAQRECNQTYLHRDGGLPLLAAHSTAWRHALAANASTFIFEGDIAIDSATRARTRCRSFASSASCDMLLLGHCAGDAINGRKRCTHAYMVTPRAALVLLWHLEKRGHCTLVGEVHKAFCDRSDACCAKANGGPGKLLYGSGIVGRDRTMPGATLRSSHARFGTLLPRSSSASSPVTLGEAPLVVAFPERFDRAARVISSLGVFPPAQRLHPAAAPTACPRHAMVAARVTGSAAGSASATAATAATSFSDTAGMSSRRKAGMGSVQLHTPGILSLAATHAAAWGEIVRTNLTRAVFEDDIAVDFPTRARARLLELARDAPCDFVFLGHCGSRGIRCTHAYMATPKAAAALLASYRETKGCAVSDDPQEHFCTRADVCCTSARGVPGAGLYGSGIIGQNRSLPHYLHFRGCWALKAWQRPGVCGSVMDYETAPEGTSLQPATASWVLSNASGPKQGV